MHKNRKTFILLLSAMSAITPLSIDMYLPAMPQMAADYGVNLYQMELSISLFFWGFGCGQLCAGPFSDAFGRRIIVLCGIFFFFLSSVAISFVPSFNTLLTLRFIQAFFGGFITVNAAATVRDHFKEKESAAILSSVASIMMLAPMLAPLIGSLFIRFGHWRLIFVFLTIYALLLAIFVTRNYKNKERTSDKTLSLAIMFKGYWHVLKHRQGLAYMLVGSAASAGLFAFITKAAFIYMDYFGLSSDLFPFFFGANVLTIIGVSRINVRLVQKHNPAQLLKMGLAIHACAGIALFLHVYFMTPSLIPVLLGTMIFIGSLGLVYGNNTACFLDFFPENSGTANALFGTMRFTLGGLAGVAGAAISQTGIAAPFILMASSAICANFFFHKMANRSAPQTYE